MKKTKHRFQRQESWRLDRVKESWRRPRGVTSRMRKEKAGWPARVKNGFGSPASTRGLHPRGLVEKRVGHLSDLNGLDPQRHIIRLSASLGEKKRLLLLERTRQLQFHIANPGKEEARPAAGEEAEGVKEEAGPVETAAGPESVGEQVSESDESTAKPAEVSGESASKTDKGDEEMEADC